MGSPAGIILKGGIPNWISEETRFQGYIYCALLRSNVDNFSNVAPLLSEDVLDDVTSDAFMQSSKDNFAVLDKAGTGLY